MQGACAPGEDIPGHFLASQPLWEAAGAPGPSPRLCPPLPWSSVLGSQDNPLSVLCPQPGQVVGIDLEWRPSFSAIGGKPQVSIVQLAIWGHVFLLDMLQLLQQGGQEARATCCCFFQSLLADPAIVKLGKWRFTFRGPSW